MIDATLQHVEAGENLSMNQAAEAIGLIMEGQCSEDDMARFLLALHHKGETVEEVAGAARAMREKMTPIRSTHAVLIDTCGTGGDRSGTFNISTAAALVTAAAGVPVAKHGNRAITSRSGSADVLKVLGVNIEAEVTHVEQCLDRLGICFCFAPLLHSAMRHVAPVRKRINTPTIFNILGPLANPARAPFQLLGVGRAELQPLMAQALKLLGSRRTLVVHGADGLDEVTLSGCTHVIEMGDGATQVFDWTPADFDLSTASLETLRVPDAAASAEVIRGILAGRAGPARDIVVANAAAALWTVGLDNLSPQQCAKRAGEAIDSHAAATLLAQLVEFTNAFAP